MLGNVVVIMPFEVVVHLKTETVQRKLHQYLIYMLIAGDFSAKANTTSKIRNVLFQLHLLSLTVFNIYLF